MKNYALNLYLGVTDYFGLMRRGDFWALPSAGDGVTAGPATSGHGGTRDGPGAGAHDERDGSGSGVQSSDLPLTALPRPSRYHLNGQRHAQNSAAALRASVRGLGSITHINIARQNATQFKSHIGSP